MSGEEGISQAAARSIEAARQALAEAVTEHQYAKDPELAGRFGPEGRAKTVEDTAYTLRYLETALSNRSPVQFGRYLNWLRVLLGNLGMEARILEENLDAVEVVLRDRLIPDEAGRAVAILREARASISETQASHIDECTPQAALAREYIKLLIGGQRRLAFDLIHGAVDAGLGIRELYLQVFQPAQWEIGRLWQINEISVAQEHYCTAATQLLMAQLYPKLFAEGDTKRRDDVVVASCIGGDLHEIGIRMVADFFEHEGWDSHYLGASTPRSDILGTLERTRASLLAVSCTLPFHLDEVGALIKAVEGLARRPAIIVGGAPFNADPELWRRMGADGTAHDADGAIRLAEELAC